MASTRQCLKCSDKNGVFSVVYHESDSNNPYWLYKHTWERNKYGYYTERKRLQVKYADMGSCLYHIAQVI